MPKNTPYHQAQQKIEAALDRLEKQNLVSRNGDLYFFLNNEHLYRKSHLDKKVEEPFYHVREHKYTGTLFFSPLVDLELSARTSYDLRTGFEREENRWSDLIINFNCACTINTQGRGVTSAIKIIKFELIVIAWV